MALSRRRRLQLELELRKRQSEAQPSDESLLQGIGRGAQTLTTLGREKVAKPLGELLSPVTKPLGQAAGQAFESLPAPAKAPLQAAGAVLGGFEKGGDALAEGLAGPGIKLRSIPGVPIPIVSPASEGEEAIKASPEVAALIGTGFKMIPEIVSALSTPGVLSAFKSVFAKQGAKQAGTFLKSLVPKRTPKVVPRKILTPEQLKVQKLTRVAKAESGAAKRIQTPEEVKDIAQKELRSIPAEEKAAGTELQRRRLQVVGKFKEESAKVTKPARERLASAERQKADLPKRKIQRKEDLAEQEGGARKEIEAAEKEAGIFLKETPVRFEKNVKDIQGLIRKGKKLRKLVAKGPENLVKTSDIKTIQANRKLFEQGAQRLEREGVINKLDRRLIRETRDFFKQSISIAAPKVGSALKQFGVIKKAIADLPREFGKADATLKSLISRTKDELDKVKSVIKTPKILDDINKQLKSLPVESKARQEGLRNIISKTESQVKNINKDLVKAKKGVDLSIAKKELRAAEAAALEEKSAGAKLKRGISTAATTAIRAITFGRIR